ncbi:SAM-dependent methyltransferase [mine drainage metagenome]|uniref:SAM-dependent methyltransferase n=1 Tax=mine drainage metagenome TaxID=410659 RepID=T1A5D7_9ZZZZ
MYAGLVNEVKSLGEFRILGEDGRRILLTSSSIPHGRFPGKVYRKLMVAGKPDLAESLRSIGAGKIYPRFALQPEESYAMKNELEKNSAGEKPVYIFRVKQGYALCEPFEDSSSQFSNEQTI